MTLETLDNLLAIDTSSKRLVLALQFGGDRLVQSDNVVEKSHGIILLKKIDELFQSADLPIDDLQGIVVCTGPGSFTGLRIGLSAAKGLAVANALPLVGVSLFDLFAAMQSSRAERLHLVLPSRKGEWYVGTLREGEIAPEDIKVVNEANLRDHIGSDTALSCGFNLGEELPGVRSEKGGGVFAYSGSDLLQVGRLQLESGRTADVTQLEPMYLQKAIAEKRFDERQRNQ